MEILFIIGLVVYFLYCFGVIFLAKDTNKTKILDLIVFISVFIVMIYFSSWLEFVMHPSQLTFREYLIMEEWHDSMIELRHDAVSYLIAISIACIASKYKKGV